MLELKKICKDYKTGNFNQKALDNINLKFRENEFVSILGPSGSGKTTFLNIVGGLDKYTSGDIIINGVSTKKYKDKDFDAYRNNLIGFIFQNYNLIPHISILSNVEMSLSLSGISKKERKKRALLALEKVGLKEHIHKKPNKLSGGEKQRVAIARAIVTNPKIILADEPTGALDTKTSKDIMDLIKEISKDKLVIMVTHNEELAKIYSTRIINLKDGKVVSDSNPFNDIENNQTYKIKRTSMNFFTALKLSLNNIFAKKGRSFLTSFASSIGIIGILLILALSNGFDIQINKFETKTLSSFPILINEETTILDNTNSNENIDETKVYSYNTTNETHTNNITKEYLNYLENIDKTLIEGITYNRYVKINALVKQDNNIVVIDTSSFTSLPKEIDNNNSYLKNGYNLLEGSFPKNKNEILIELDSNNRLDKNILKIFNITDDKIDINKLIGKEIRIILNDDYYIKTNDIYTSNSNLEEMYNSKDSIILKVVGVIKAKDDNKIAVTENTLTSNSNGKILYTDSLMEYIIEKNSNSKIVKDQINSNTSVISMQSLTEEEKTQNLVYFGGLDIPYLISIYPKNKESKEKIINYLDKYNENNDKIIYKDLAKTAVELTSSLIDGITYVLVAFSAISLIVSSIMIGIITYISVLERTKEIGILRSLGARKKDIKRVFNAENFLIGLTSGILGILITKLLIIPTNIILENLTSLEGIAKINITHMIIMILISIIITLIGGTLPSRLASRKNIVEALNRE